MGKRSAAEARMARFRQTTERYWEWLALHCEVDPKGKREKTRKMRQDAQAFLRGSFYFWGDLLGEAALELMEAPKILCIGDAHVENFGAWRDGEGRLVWGVNDFDDAARLPFTSDLVRLATSVMLAAKVMRGVDGVRAARRVLNAYSERLGHGPEAFVLEDFHPEIRDLAAVSGKAAIKFWKKQDRQPKTTPGRIAREALTMLKDALPKGARILGWRKPLSGTGSLGRLRYTVLAEWKDGRIAREVKAVAPSSAYLARQSIAQPTGEYRQIEQGGVRIPDPHLSIGERWICRRLSPEARKIELSEIKHARARSTLFAAMGQELANVHLGMARAPSPLREFLKAQGPGRMLEAAEMVAERVEGLAARFREEK